MAVEKLKEALSEEARKELENVIANLRLELDIYCKKRDDDLKNKKEEIKQHAEKLLKEKRAKILLKAKRVASNILILSQEKAIRRFYQLGLKVLSTLRDENYAHIFAQLVKEVSVLQWEEVKVNSKDYSLAKEFFGDIKITAEDALTGGFILYAEDRKIVINNSFEKRWEKCYEALVPLMLKELHEYITNNEK